MQKQIRSTISKTANAAVITTFQGLNRSGTAPTFTLRTGTTTVQHALGMFWMMDDSVAGEAPAGNPWGGSSMILRPGEGVYFMLAIVNSACSGYILCRELTYPLPTLPPRL